MKGFIFGVAALALTGCVSTQSALSKDANEMVQSNKTQAEVAFCLANKNLVPALDGPNGEKIIQVKNPLGAVLMVFSVFKDGEGSRIEIRKVAGLPIPAHRQCY